jgi:hypothetical protein
MMLISKDHPNYQSYLRASHQLSLEMSARLQAVAETYGENEEGVNLARALQVEEAKRRKTLQQMFAGTPPEASETSHITHG